MPRPKPRFNRAPADRNATLAPAISDFSPALIKRLATCCPPRPPVQGKSPRPGVESDARVPPPAPPLPSAFVPGRLAQAVLQEFPLRSTAADLVLQAKAETLETREQIFAHAILAQARWAGPELARDRQSLTRDEVLAEINYFSDRVGELVRHLPTMSPEVAILQPFDPLDVADYLRPIAEALARSAAAASQRAVKRRPVEAQRPVAVELAIRVLRVCKLYGMLITTGTTSDATPTRAIRVMEIVGEAVKIPRSTFTWRDVIAEARKTAPDLR